LAIELWIADCPLTDCRLAIDKQQQSIMPNRHPPISIGIGNRQSAIRQSAMFNHQ
jgi:hypothetical protein